MMEDIVLEEANGGSMILDVLHVNDRLIACSPGKLFVYNGDGTTLLSSFNIPANGKSYGKFAPGYFRDDVYVPGARRLAYNPEANVIYLVSADLTIQGYAFNNQGNLEHLGTIIPRPAELDHMKVLHGFSIIKYDEVHNRLFWIVQGKNSNESMFQFHVREVFLGIYKTDGSGELAYLIHSEVNSLDDNPPENYLNAIHDITFMEFNNHYYLARLQRVDIFDIHDIPGQCSVNLVHQHPMTLGKIGKLLYIDEIDKVLAFPYRLPFQYTEPPAGHQVKIYILDVNNYHMDSCNSPDKRIYDAIYLPALHDLIMCRNPVNDPNYLWIADQDIAVYHWNGSGFTYSENDLINTNGFPGADEPNTPVRMMQIGNNGVLISKKHEVVHLFHDGDSYSFSQKHSGLNNLFGAGTVSGDRTFVINMVNNGFERFDENLYHLDNIRTASPVYQVVHNGTYDRLFFFHTLNSYHSGIYIYNGSTTTNLNDINGPFARIDKPVGSCVYNPYKNQILVSVNAPAENNFGEIKCYDATTGIYAESIQLTGNGYCKEMFLAPNGYLYITSNMKIDFPRMPVIFVLNAHDYTQLNGTSGQSISTIVPSNDSEYYTADFCFNPFNEKVYATIKPQENMPLPYTTARGSRDSVVLETDMQAGANGWFLTLTSEMTDQDDSTFVNPGKIFCRTPLTGNIDNETGYLFILSDRFTIFDCDGEAFHHTQALYQDMAYSPLYDELYVIRQGATTNNGDDFDLLKLSFTGTTLNVSEMSTGHPGYAGAFFMNNYDQRLYVYHKLDNKMLGDLSARLIKVDPASGYDSMIELGDTPFYCYYPEVIQMGQIPVIDPYRNRMYIPNGAHSSVSMVGFTASEALPLEPGYNWLSVPRHSRPTDPGWTLISDVFDQLNFSTGYSDLELLYNKTDPGNNVNYFATWNPQSQWVFIPNSDDCKRTFSNRGYVLDLNQPETGNILMMNGEVEPLNTSAVLYCLEENWIGYFIYEEQRVFDALESVVEHLYHIKHQDYECWRYNYPIPQNCREKSSADIPPGTWICNGRPVIRYGEMIKVKPVVDILDFEWDYTGKNPFEQHRPEVKYYEFDRKDDYTTIVIELDTTTNNPQEIGAFVNDTCVGACSVIDQDAVVVLSAHLGDTPGDSVDFEEYYGPMKQSGNKITKYMVMDQRKLDRQKRTIKTGEDQDVYIISFLPDSHEEFGHTDNLSVKIYPNPGSGRFFIDYELSSKSTVNLEVYDLFGRKTELISGKVQPPGKYQIIWDTNGNSSRSFEPGIYLVRLRTHESTVSCKVIVQ